MKRIVLLAVLISIVGMAYARKKKEEKPNPDPKSWVTKLKWSKYERTDISSVDAFYAQGDTIYKHLTDLADDMIFYDVRKIVNTTTGDTLVAVVDDQGNIRGGKAAFKQYLQAGFIAATILQDISSTIETGKSLKTNWKELVKTDDAIETLHSSKGDVGNSILSGISILTAVSEDAIFGKKLGQAVKEMISMNIVVGRDLKNGFATQRKKIKSYLSYIQQPEATPYDPPLRSLPDMPMDDVVLSKSDQEILAGLANAKKEDDDFISEHGESIFDNVDV